VEKPLGLTIEQNLAIAKLFKENKLVFQYGTMQRSMSHCYRGSELVRRGAIGKVKRIEVTCPDNLAGGSTQEVPVPPTFDYDLWLGPAPKAPYTVDRCVNPGHFHIYDYSIGYLAGWGSHPLDIMVWASDADLSGPITVEGKGIIPTEGLYNNVMTWEMDIMLGDVPLSFKTGEDMTKFYGDDGRWIDIRRRILTASDPAIIDSFDESAKSILQASRSANHAEDFILAIKEGKRAVTSLEEAVRSDMISHLCDIAVRTNYKVKWDPKKFEFISAPDAAKKMISRRMRSPWTL
jgi:predicted dehydrogenase